MVNIYKIFEHENLPFINKTPLFDLTSRKGEMKRILIKNLQRDILNIKQERDAWQEKFQQREKEYLILRRWIQKNFDWWLALIQKQSGPDLVWLLKDTAKILGMKEE